MSDMSRGDGWSTRREGVRTVLVLWGDWIAREREEVTDAQTVADAATGGTALAFDAGRLGRWDSALIAFLWELRREVSAQGILFDDSALPGPARRLLALLREEAPSASVPSPRPSVFARVGLRTIGLHEQIGAMTELLGEIILRSGAALRGRAMLRGVDVLNCAREAGAAALPIVTIVNLLVGAILAFVGAVQLRRFGAEIFVANLVGIATVREMAAVMTAIVMAGRTGGAYAAEIATMQGNEEIDALRVVGIPVQDYLLIPRISALTIMMPILYLYACAVGLVGGFVVSVGMLHLTADAYIAQTRYAFGLMQFAIGLTKSIAFGALIAFVSCQIGLRAGRSAADVGHASTSAVVAGIVGVIALDGVFAVCTDALGI